MGIVIRIHGIESPNNFKVSVKEGNTPYPLDIGYKGSDIIYSGGTTEISLSGITDASEGKFTPFFFDTQYWVKITDQVTDRYIIENIYVNDDIAYQDCCSPPLILSVDCYLSGLDCALVLTATQI